MVLTVLVVSFSARVDTKNIPQSAYMLRLNYERLRGTRITTKVLWSALNSTLSTVCSRSVQRTTRPAGATTGETTRNPMLNLKIYLS